MFSKLSARLLLSILFCAAILQLKAQPVLPGIGGTSDKAIVILTWNCQYDGIKSIAVQRSSDSIHNFATIGYVKNLKRGVQAFIDGHPGPGKNWYQLYIVFNSDLTWMSNRVKLMIDSATLASQKAVLPPNDSLQNITINENGEMKRPKTKTGLVINIDTNAKTKTSLSDAGGYMTSSTDSVSSGAGVPQKPHVISISLSADISEANPNAYIRSNYVFTNPLTGHVNMELPDIKEHHYSIRFFNDKEKKVLDVQKLATSPIILDKRNFERKGIYKFILKRDNSEFDTGYITIF